MTIVLISDAYSFDKGTAVIVREDFMESKTEFRAECNNNKMNTEIDKAGTYFVVIMGCEVEERKNHRRHTLSILMLWTLIITDQDLRNGEVPFTVAKAELYRITSKEQVFLCTDLCAGPYSLELTPPDESRNVVFFDDPRKSSRNPHPASLSNR